MTAVTTTAVTTTAVTATAVTPTVRTPLSGGGRDRALPWRWLCQTARPVMPMPAPGEHRSAEQRCPTQHLQLVPCSCGPPSPCPHLSPMCTGAAVAPPTPHINRAARLVFSRSLACTLYPAPRPPRWGLLAHHRLTPHGQLATAPDAPHAPAHRAAHARRRARTRTRRTHHQPRSGRGQTSMPKMRFISSLRPISPSLLASARRSEFC